MKENYHSIGLRTLEDISSIILHSHNLQETLDNIVNIVAKRMRTDVCSIYLLDGETDKLVLKATKGLSKASINRTSMRTSEGLCGLVVESRDMVMTDNAPAHPRYKYFRETREEKFLSFLGLPLFDRNIPIGMIAVQTCEARRFNEDEISVLRTITFQIGSIIQNARLLDSIQRREQEKAWLEQELTKARNAAVADSIQNDAPDLHPIGMNKLRGTAVSYGFRRGKVYILDRFSDKVIKVAKVGTQEEEQVKFTTALEKVKIQTIYMEKQVSEKLSEDDAGIFHTHLMILEDRGFSNKVIDLINQDIGASRAVFDVVRHYIQAFETMEDPYLRERSADMKDIGRRIIDALEGNDNTPQNLRENRIIVAEEIFPSDLAMLDHDKIIGIVTEKGNVHSHAAIMSKSLGIPAIVGVPGLMEAANVKDRIILDGASGFVFLNPDRAIIQEYKRLEQSHASHQKELEGLRDLPATTTDGVTITLSANIGLLSDVRMATFHGAQGVGLYRTEFPYMARSSFPTRAEQATLYRKILAAFPDHCVNIRTLDIGGDKGLSYFRLPHEDNPFMGMRSIRLSLAQQDIFRDQLAAILMAADTGNPTIMFPLISSIDEIREIKKIITEVQEELKYQGHLLEKNIPLGIMVEIPAAVQIIEFLLNEVDYVSIGANDLVQYTLAADRNNSRMKQYYNPHHPAVLHSMKRIADAAAKAGKKASVCGEMASDPLTALMLTGIGLREFSISAPSIPVVKQAIRSHSLKECQRLANEILGCCTGEEIISVLTMAREEMRL